MKTSTFREEMGAALKEARVKERLTMRELAERMEVTTTTVSRYESGKGNLSIDIICRIAENLGLRPEIKFYKNKIKGKSNNKVSK